MYNRTSADNPLQVQSSFWPSGSKNLSVQFGKLPQQCSLPPLNKLPQPSPYSLPSQIQAKYSDVLGRERYQPRGPKSQVLYSDAKGRRITLNDGDYQRFQKNASKASYPDRNGQQNFTTTNKSIRPPQPPARSSGVYGQRNYNSAGAASSLKFDQFLPPAPTTYSHSPSVGPTIPSGPGTSPAPATPFISKSLENNTTNSGARSGGIPNGAETMTSTSVQQQVQTSAPSPPPPPPPAPPQNLFQQQQPQQQNQQHPSPQTSNFFQRHQLPNPVQGFSQHQQQQQQPYNSQFPNQGLAQHFPAPAAGIFRPQQSVAAAPMTPQFYQNHQQPAYYHPSGFQQQAPTPPMMVPKPFLNNPRPQPGGILPHQYFYPSQQQQQFQQYTSQPYCAPSVSVPTQSMPPVSQSLPTPTSYTSEKEASRKPEGGARGDDFDLDFEILKEQALKTPKIWQTSDELPDPGLRAAVYQVELRQQIDENRRRRAERIAREKLEEEQLERKIQEFQEEERRRMDLEERAKAKLQQYHQNKIEQKQRRKYEAFTISHKAEQHFQLPPPQPEPRQRRQCSRLVTPRGGENVPRNELAAGDFPRLPPEPQPVENDYDETNEDEIEEESPVEDPDDNKPDDEPSSTSLVKNRKPSPRPTSPPVPVVQRRLQGKAQKFVKVRETQVSPVSSTGQDFFIQLKERLISEKDLVERRLQQKVESTHKNINLLKYTLNK